LIVIIRQPEKAKTGFSGCPSHFILNKETKMTNLAPYHTFLATPNNDTLDAFVDSRAAIFVDWHEGDTDILDYLNDRLPDGAKIDYEETGDAIALIKNGAREPIPYQRKGRDRDTTLLAAQRYLGAAWQIR
ncbi:hypothetical protein, partial [uncultured Kingella sp.]|uniref:hypothetical protein n=2 Tax=Kingella TaxID=32257 RepID=UPI002594AEDF